MGESTSQASLVLHVQGSGSRRLTAPIMTLDGEVLPTGFGRHQFPVAAGDHVLVAHEKLWGRDPVERRFLVEPGHQVELWYAPPVQRGFDGKFGTSPQRRPGLSLMGTLVVAFIVIGLLVTYLR